MRFRGGALKTDWAKPWHGGAGYGDRIAPALLSGAFELAGAGGSVAPAAMMECVPGCRCAGGGSRRVRDVLAVGWAAESSGGLVAASGPSEALRGLAGHEVSSMGGLGLAGLSTSMMTMRPYRQAGHSLREVLVNSSYRSR